MRTSFLALIVLLPSLTAAADASDWPRWRGPDNDGMARGDAPLHWSDREHIKWKAEIPGRGHSSPVIWGDRVFVTTSVPTGVVPPSRNAFGIRLLGSPVETSQSWWAARVTPMWSMWRAQCWSG